MSQTALTLVPSAIAVTVAVLVPWFTFRLALRQDRDRRLHDQRAHLYVDLLTEAYAETRQFEYEIADEDTRKRMQSYRTDLRLPPLERARLGSRGTIFASRPVNRLFTQLQGIAALTTLVDRAQNEGDRTVARARIAGAFEALEVQVRREMGADAVAPFGRQIVTN